MHIKAVATGTDLTDPDDEIEKEKGEKKKDLDNQPPHPLPTDPSPKLTVSLAWRSHYGDPAHSSVPQPLPARL